MRLGFFEGRILVEPMEDFWCLRESFLYVAANGDVYQIPEGTLTDWASIPRLFWPVLPPTDRCYTWAAVIHDFFYSSHVVSRELADALLYEASVTQGSSRVRAYILWLAVRLGGARAYRTGPARQQALKRQLAAIGLT